MGMRAGLGTHGGMRDELGPANDAEPELVTSSSDLRSMRRPRSSTLTSGVGGRGPSASAARVSEAPRIVGSWQRKVPPLWRHGYR